MGFTESPTRRIAHDDDDDDDDEPHGRRGDERRERQVVDMRVAVTGAAGLVGRAVCHSLAAIGDYVIAVTRHPQTAPAIAHEERAVGNLESLETYACLDGVDAVVHVAGCAHRKLPAEAQSDVHTRANRDVTVRLATAASNAGVKRFVYFSTLKVNGESSSPGQPWTEDTPAQPLDAYGRSKWEAEQFLAGLAQSSELETVVIRPPLVYGPGVKANFAALLRAVDRHVPLPFGLVDNLRSFVYVGNLASATADCVHHPAAANRLYFVTDGEDLSTAELVRRIGHALERRTVLLPVPLSWLAAVGRLAGRAGAVERLTTHFQAQSTRIRRELGWKPRFSVEEGLRETAEWFKGRRG